MATAKRRQGDLLEGDLGEQSSEGEEDEEELGPSSGKRVKLEQDILGQSPGLDLWARGEEHWTRFYFGCDV